MELSTKGFGDAKKTLHDKTTRMGVVCAFEKDKERRITAEVKEEKL